MANINKMAESGKLQIAGPFGDDGNWRGIFIFDVATEEEVKELLKDDPAIQSGRLAYEIHPWWTLPGRLFEVKIQCLCHCEESVKDDEAISQLSSRLLSA